MQPVLPLWASPMFVMHRLSPSGGLMSPPPPPPPPPPAPTTATRSRGSRSSGARTPGRRVKRRHPVPASGSRDGGRGSPARFTAAPAPQAAPEPGAAPSSGAVATPALTLDDLFMDTSGSQPVLVRRAGPQPVAMATSVGAATTTTQSARAPAPSAPSLSDVIRQAVETPLVDSVPEPMDVDPPTDAPRVAVGHGHPAGSPARDSSPDLDLFGPATSRRHAAIARVHSDAVDSNATAAAALFDMAASAEAPHLISAEASCVLPPAGSFVGDEPPPASSPHGDVVGRSRRLSAESESGQDTVWADSSLCLPVGNKVAFDASRPNVVGDSDDDEEE